jgi:hypothetical protein
MSQPFLNAPLAKAAFAIVKPVILDMMDRGRVKRRAFHIVIAAPRTAPAFDVLYEESIGDPPESWEAPFDQIARSKARITWRTGKSSSYIAHCAPHLLTTEDTIYWGSDVLDELVSAGSGVEPYFDEMYSGMTSLAIRALCKQRHALDSAAMRERGYNFFDSTKQRT